MDCDGIEITLHGHQVCIPRYWQTVEVIAGPGPDPGPPGPDDYRKAFADVGLLANIADGLSRINNEHVRLTLREAVRDGFSAIDLPKGVKVGAGVLAGLTPRR